MSIDNLSQLQDTPSWQSRKTNVICVGVIQETPDVKTFQFQSKEPQLFHFKPGQFIGIQLEIDGEKHNRSYTIASSPSRPHILELTIKKEKGGSVSPWLHKNIVEGSEVELRGPAGRFNCFDIPSKKVLLVSAGSGITPMMSMARFWTDTDPNKEIQFLNWARGVEDIIFRRELSLIDFKNKNFQLEVFCTQPGLSENWLGKRGRINTRLLSDMVTDLDERMVFCCGPDGFMQQVKTCLKELGFNMDNYHDETFDPGGKKKAKLEQQEKELKEAPQEIIPIGPFNLSLKRSNKRVVIEEDEILLEKLESEGVNIDTGCRAGNCGACMVKKISGETVSQNDIGLQDSEKEQGYILTCTTSLKSDVELDL